MSTDSGEPTVGLLPQGGTDWIAGVVYPANITRAARAMRGRQPAHCVVASPGSQPERGAELTVDVPLHFYTPRSHHPWSRVVWNSVMSRRLPQSLEALVRRAGLGVLFPLQVPPTERLPVPWIGWIPDFQHK